MAKVKEMYDLFWAFMGRKNRILILSLASYAAMC
jgi:hypothetical protein